ncbi:MAG: sugar phosphate nucleotidyltransferase [Streptosporangiaceae bacterium]
MGSHRDVGPGAFRERGQAVILSAGLGTRIAIVAHGRPKALVTAASRPALVTQLQQLHRSGVRRITVVNALGDDRQLRPLVAQVFSGAELDVRFVVQDRPVGPLDALRRAAPHLVGDDVLLLLGDTLVDDLSALPPDSVGLGQVDEVREFCIARVYRTGRIGGYVDKPDRDSSSDHAVVGAYRFADAELLRELLQDDATPVTGELSDLLERYGQQRPLTGVTVGWRDLGSYDRYITANRAAVRGRASHAFVIADDGSVVKSGERSLMATQAEWYRALPETAVELAPRLLGVGDGWYRVELLDYPNLAQLLLYELLPPRTWQFLLTRLLEITERRLWAPTRRPDAALPVWCGRKYVTKTEHRLASWPRWGRLRGQRLTVNGVELPCFDELWPAATKALHELSAAATHSCLIHGDMTFSNILLARRYGTFKLLDPGTTFSNSPGGDVRYDLAKLRQCYAGGYDALSEDLFSLEESGPGRWELCVFPRTSPIAEIGDEILAAAGHSLDEVRLLEAVQFLSMVPLHHDSVERQLALYARGLQLLTAAMEGTFHALTPV